MINYLILRTCIYIEHSLPEDSYDKMMLYLREIIRLRRDNNINKTFLLLNIDETPIFLHMPKNKTV